MRIFVFVSADYHGFMCIDVEAYLQSRFVSFVQSIQALTNNNGLVFRIGFKTSQWFFKSFVTVSLWSERRGDATLSDYTLDVDFIRTDVFYTNFGCLVIV